MTKQMKVVYMVGKRTSASNGAARHIDDGNGNPLCGKHTKSGKNLGSGWVSDFDEPTCKLCLAQSSSDPAPAEDPTAPIPVSELDNFDESPADTGTLIDPEPANNLPDAWMPQVGDRVVVTGGQSVGATGVITKLMDTPRNTFLYLLDTVPGDYKSIDEIAPAPLDVYLDCDGTPLHVNDWVETLEEHYGMRVPVGERGVIVGFTPVQPTPKAVVTFPFFKSIGGTAILAHYETTLLKKIDPPAPNPDPIDYDAYNGGLADAALNALVEADIKRAEQKSDPRAWATPERRAEVNALLEKHKVYPLELHPSSDEGVWLMEDEWTVKTMRRTLDKLGVEIIGELAQDWNGDEPYCVARFRLPNPTYQPYPSKRQTKPMPDAPSIFAQYDELRTAVTTRLLIQVNGDEWAAYHTTATITKQYLPGAKLERQTVNQKGEQWDKLTVPADQLNALIKLANADGVTVALASIVKDEPGKLPERAVTEIFYADGSAERIDITDDETTPDEPEAAPVSASVEEYIYISLTRPAWRGETVPELGFIRAYRADHPVWAAAECVVYDHKLGRAEMERYELRPYSDNAYEFTVGQRVTWLYNDDEYVITGREDGRYHLLHECGDAPPFVKEIELTTAFVYDSHPVAVLIVDGIEPEGESAPVNEPAPVEPDHIALQIKNRIVGGMRLGLATVKPHSETGWFAVTFVHVCTGYTITALKTVYEVKPLEGLSQPKTLLVRPKSASVMPDVQAQADAVIAALPEPTTPEPEAPAVELLSEDEEQTLIAALRVVYPDLDAACFGVTHFLANVIARMQTAAVAVVGNPY